MGKLLVALLAGFHMGNGFGELAGQRHGDQNQALLAARGAAQNVVGSVPGELCGFAEVQVC